MKQYDFVAIGDIVVDAFIRLIQANIYTEEGIEQLCLVNGSKIPYESVTVVPSVGNSPNAAVTAARLGLSTALITNLGNDENGKSCLATLTKEGIETPFVRIHDNKKTNYHYVLWFKDERTILIKHEEYPYEFPDIGSPRWIYLSSLGEKSLPYHKAITTYLDTHPDIKLAFQPGTFQIKLGKEKLATLYKKTEIFFCNTDEARIILENKEQDGIVLARAISALGPKIAVITDGPRGAYCYDSHTGNAFFMPPYPDPQPPFERTGAGDAFSSTFTAAIALGHNIEDALRWAPINSMSVVQKIGAQEGLLSQSAIEEFLQKAPTTFAPEKR